MIRIIHTADIHLGMGYKNWQNEKAKKAAREERFEAMKRIVHYANDNSADYLVIAGDLFDKISVSSAVVKEAVKILNESLIPVVIIPGNHDFYEAEDSKLWKSFLAELGLSDTIHLLRKYQPTPVDSGDRTVIFYPCYCQAKTSPHHNIGWIERTGESADAHIGIAHGNIEGLALGKDKYFNMKREDLHKKNLDLWLMGHVHVPYPTPLNFTNEKILMPGTPTPDGFDRSRDGGFFDIQMHSPDSIDVKWTKCSQLVFRQISKKLHHLNDIGLLKRELEQLLPHQSLVQLELSGRLTPAEKEELAEMIREKTEQFLLLSTSNRVIDKIEQKDIDASFTEQSLPHQILSDFVSSAGDDPNRALALELCFNLFVKHKQ